MKTAVIAVVSILLGLTVIVLGFVLTLRIQCDKHKNRAKSLRRSTSSTIQKIVKLPRGYNPSVVFRMGKPIYSVRVSRKGLGSLVSRFRENMAMTVGTSRTRLVVDGKYVDLPLPESSSEFSEEDGRLISFPDGETLGLVCSRKHRDRSIKDSMSLVTFRLNPMRVIERVSFASYDGGKKHQKNWSPFFYDGFLHFVQRFNPLRVLRVTESKDIRVATDASDINSRVPENLRGGSQIVPYSGSLMLGIGHTKEYPLGFRHHMYVMRNRPPFNIVACSEPFVLDDRNFRADYPHIIEFVSGLCRVGNGDFVITYGSWNETPNEMTISASDIQKLLKLETQKRPDDDP